MHGAYKYCAVVECIVCNVADQKEIYKMSEQKINVFDSNGNVIARVNANKNLDIWDGDNWTCGSVGHHLGITKLKKSGQFVLIHTSQWKGETDTAEIVSAKEAFENIIQFGKTDLLERWPELQEFLEQIETEEDL